MLALAAEVSKARHSTVAFIRLDIDRLNETIHIEVPTDWKRCDRCFVGVQPLSNADDRNRRR